MSAVEDVRQVVQDFLAPELRAVAVQIEALNRRMDNPESKTGIQFSAAKTEATGRQEIILLQDDPQHSLAPGNWEEIFAALDQAGVPKDFLSEREQSLPQSRPDL